MSWQEQLRRLDEELAAGQISADDYRVRRDRVLSSAVSSDPAPTPTPPAPEGPPAPQQDAGKDDADKTQIVPNDADRTQAVGGGWHTARPPGDFDRTQAVPGVPPQAVAGGHGPLPAPGPEGRYGQYGSPPNWQQPHEELAPPWAGHDLPPLSSTANPSWIRQGPEVFETGDRSGTGKVLLIVLAVVLVAGIGVGAYFLFTPDQTEPVTQPTTTNQPTATTTTPAQPNDDLYVAELPGNAEIPDHIKSFADFETDELGKLLTSEETAAYNEVNPSKCRVTVSDLDNEAHAYILTVETDSESSAAHARDGLVELQTKYSMQPYSGGSPEGVKSTQFAKTGDIPATIRAHYAHKTTIVRVQIYGNDLDEIGPVFDEILQKQLKALPADA